ncbi:hypothetical protein SODALDRAFT_334581 [Sodiomyces alkalinus F11]|uniref:VOC domain-containing protein n=1 Tax=Sodiomyces alkalinus (strain CBS 110278 / VKM F-3762 / F11) TaxID=1314773 RepID=A0A3N2PSL8_SODAK|nr:hypothetical protein SODALDRAFT_334581 [Sodiomyces alkalinus F11]ROT37478.1 hypothetical protein SODALDRAFT_334581 [Sodiomyces alkalinus F11]
MVLVYTNSLCLDVAARFYKTVFDFEWVPSPRYDASELQMFDFSGKGVNISGGIQKVPDETGLLNAGPGGVCIHWLVESLEDSARAIEGAGGEVLTGTMKEGDFGVYRYFKDTEGNVGSMHQMVTKSA